MPTHHESPLSPEGAGGASSQHSPAQPAGNAGFHTLADVAPTMIWVCAPDRRRSWVNQHLLCFTGRSLAEECGDGWIDGLHAEDRAECLEAFSEAFERRQAFELEYRLRNADGEYRWIADSGAPHYGPAGEFLGYVGAWVDRTPQRFAQRQAAEARELAEQANRSRCGFLSSASHDLRQPLAALSLYVEVLKSRRNPDTAELVANIASCLGDLSERITDLLDLGKLEAGLVSPRPSDFPVGELLAALQAGHADQARQKGLALRLRSTSAIAFSDHARLRRLLDKLLANAIRFTTQGGVLLACRRRQGRLWLEIRDTGCGIPDERRQLIEEEFLHPDDGRKGGGGGLGLAIVARTAQVLGLSLRVASHPGRGSLFAIELPAGRAHSTVGEAARRPPSRHIRIALVDDNREVLQALVFVLRDAGYEVVGRPGAKALLEALGQEAPDVVISDYRLSGPENGFGVIQAVRQAFGADLPALLITGNTDPQLIRSMAEQGIAVHFKPLQIDALQAFIAEATERRAL